MPATPDEPQRSGAAIESPLDEASSFARAGSRSTIVVLGLGLFVLVAAYLATVRFAEAQLGMEFSRRVEQAIEVDNFDVPVAQQIRERIEARVDASRWVRLGGLRVTILVLAQDELTWLYVDGHAERTFDGLAPGDLLSEWMSLLPARAEVTTTLPHTAPLSIAILVSYALILLQVLFVNQKRVARRDSERLQEAVREREAAAQRASEIGAELAATRSRLSEIEPKERKHSDEIDHLQREREELHRRLARLAAREEALRGHADRAVDLAQEVRALEDLLEEATSDLDSKGEEIDRLETSLRKASKSSGKAQNAKAKTADNLARRFRTLYKTVEIDERALTDIAGLGDASLRLKAEEAVKRLADEADNVAVRRKVGGLPDHVQVFEIGFAGKGRIYYAKGKSRRFRILCVGAKNTQDADLDYLSRMSKDEFS